MAFPDDLEALSRRFTEALRRGDAGAAAAVYEADAELFLTASEVARGRDKIEAVLAAMVAGYAETGEPVTELTTLWTSASGDLAAALQTDGTSTYFLGFHRHTDGWLIAREVVVAP